jgi:ArsR family transcriptional regulator
MLSIGKNKAMDTLEFSAEVLKAIAQPTRLKIIELLQDGEHCVCEIFPAIGHEQSNTSRHLQTMLKSGILNQRKDGLKIYYSLRHPEVQDMVRLAERIAAHEAIERAALFAK